VAWEGGWRGTTVVLLQGFSFFSFDKQWKDCDLILRYCATSISADHYISAFCKVHTVSKRETNHEPCNRHACTCILLIDHECTICTDAKTDLLDPSKKY
jgi:hypothetical protein